MGIRVGLVLKLAAEIPIMFRSQFNRLGQHPAALLRGGCEDNACTKKTHQLASFDAEILSHHDNQRVTLAGTHHRQADPCIATCRFDHGLSGRQLSIALRRLDDAKRKTILD